MTTILQFPVKAMLSLASTPRDWNDAEAATARPLPVQRVETPRDAYGSTHDTVATDDTNCGLCGDPIAKGESAAVTRAATPNAVDMVVHGTCMASELAKELRVLSVFGRRSRR